MALWRDQRKHGEAARATADLEGEGGPAGTERRRGSLYGVHTVKSTSLRNLLDAASTFRAGR